MTYGKIDIGNVRGIQGDKGEKGERGRTPSYDDLRYQKQGDDFITIKGVGEFTQTDYYLDVNGNLCDADGHLYDENMNITDEIGEPFDITEYGYKYQPIWEDSEGNYTNNKGELLDENWKVQYVKSDFISDIASFIFDDEEGYNELVGDIYPHVVDTLVSADPEDEKYRDFFDEIEGDIKYYLCADNPKTNIYLNNGTVVNTCRYYDENGVVVKDNNYEELHVQLEKNTLYLYNPTGVEDNNVMHYDVYLCTKAGTVPKKIISSADFSIDYNVIDDFNLTVTDKDNDDENEVWLNILTRGTRGQFYSISDVDTLFDNNVISKLGANNGIAQLNSSGKVPSNQLPAYIDDVVEGSMNASETTFTPSDNDYIDSVRQKGKIYVDTNSRKTYRWTGSKYIFISNPIVVDDDSTEAFASVSGKALETKMGNATLNTSNKTVTGAINEHESDISSLNTNKQDKTDNSLTTTNKTVVGAINENKTNISSLTSNKQDKTDNSLNTTAKTVVGAINEHESDITSLNNNKQDKTDNSLTTTAKTISGAINEHETDISSLNTNKQNKSDNTLTTSNKTVTGAINELNTTLNELTSEDNGVVTFDNIEEMLDVLLSETVVVSSKNPIIMTGDSTRLIAKIYGDYDGTQTIQFYEKIDGGNDVLLSTVTTNNGVAYYDFTGNGTGERKYYAKWGSFLSETYDVTDAKAIFNGTSYVTSQGNLVDNGDGTYTIYPNPNNYCIFRFNSTTAQASGYFADIGGAFEFDVVSYTGAITLRNNVSGGSIFNVNTIWDNNTHYKIEIIDNGVKFNGTVKTTSDTGARDFVLRLEDGASITIKNLLYY